MAKLPRVTCLPFASSTGTDEVEKFGSLAAGGAVYTTDPAVIQALSNWAAGWFGAVLGQNAPAIQDLNGVCLVFSYMLCSLFQDGVSAWDTGTTYYVGSFVSVSGDLYVSQTDGNIGHNPATDFTNWKLYTSSKALAIQQNQSVRVFKSYDIGLGGLTPTAICWSPTLKKFASFAVNIPISVKGCTSPDGIVWTAGSTIDNSNYSAIVWSTSLGIFCAVASSVFTGATYFATSTDGLAWTAQTRPANTVTTGPLIWIDALGLFIAGVNFNAGTFEVATSNNGTSWTNRTTPNIQWAGFAYSPQLTLVVAVGSNAIATSPDGVTWTSRTSPSAQHWQSVDWSPTLGLFVAVASDTTGSSVMTSPDGITWTARTGITGIGLTSITWSNELQIFVAGGGSGGSSVYNMVHSTDGVNWFTSWTTEGQVGYLAWSPLLSLFVGSGTLSSNVALSL